MRRALLAVPLLALLAACGPSDQEGTTRTDPDGDGPAGRVYTVFDDNRARGVAKCFDLLHADPDPRATCGVEDFTGSPLDGG